MSDDSRVVEEACRECGMPCTPTEYHPYAACLMFRGCHNSKVVRENLRPLSLLAEAEAELHAFSLSNDDAEDTIEELTNELDSLKGQHKALQEELKVLRLRLDAVVGLLDEVVSEYKSSANYWGEGNYGEDDALLARVEETKRAALGGEST